MTFLNTASHGRGKAYEPGPIFGALPLPTNEDSTERLRSASQTQFSTSPSTFAPRKRQAIGDVELPVRLFDARAAFKLKTATLAVAHFTNEERGRLFKQLDSLFDADSWDSDDVVTTDLSFTTLLRMTLFLGGRRPALGVTGLGNFIATWTEGSDRLTIECKPDDQVRWVLVQSLDGQRESAAGETTVRRLPEVLRPYDPAHRWFPHAANQAAA